VALLLVLAPRELDVGAIKSPTSGETRIYVDLPTWDDFVGEGIDELLVAAQNSPMVLGRAKTNLTRLAEQVSPDRRSDVNRRIRQVDAYIRAGGLVLPGMPDDPLSHQEISR
jgi:hypothetical protein